MAITFHPLPVDVFDEQARPFIKRLNLELRDLFGLEGTLRQPITSRKSDFSITRRGEVQVDVTRITPTIVPSTSGGGSTTIGAPNLTLSTTNIVGSTTTVLSVNSTVALFGTQAPLGLSLSAAVGTSAFAARADHVHAGFDATVPAALAAAAATGIIDFAARRDHVHLFPPTLRSTANASTLTLTDDAVNQVLAGSLGQLSINPVSTLSINIGPTIDNIGVAVFVDGTSAPATSLAVAMRPGAGTRTGVAPSVTSGAFATAASETLRGWDGNLPLTGTNQFGSSSGGFNATIVSSDATVSITPAANSGLSNSVYGFRTNNLAINNANASWLDACGGYFKGPKRTVAGTPVIAAPAGVIVEPATIGGVSQYGIYVRQQTAQIAATNRYGIAIDAQNSGTSRYCVYGVSDMAYFTGPLRIGGRLAHEGSQAGLYGVSTVAQSTGWSASGFTASKTLNGASFSLNDLMSFVGALATRIQDLGAVSA